MLVAIAIIILVTRVARLVTAIIAFSLVLPAMAIIAIGATIVPEQRRASNAPSAEISGILTSSEYFCRRASISCVCG